MEDINVVEKTVWIRTKEYKNEFVAFMTYFENAEMDRLNALEKGDKIVLYIDSAWDRHINKDNMFIQIISMNCNGEGILSMVEYNSHLSHLNRRAMITAVTGISVLLTIIVVLSISLVRNTRDGSVS